MLYKLKALWCKYNPFDLGVYFDNFGKQLGEVQVSLYEVQSKLDYEIETLEKDLKLHRALLHTIGDSIPDMMWLKDMDGVYMYANKSIKTKLLFDMNPIGKNDIQMATQAKKHFGDNNHTFGEKCANSDAVVRETLKPQRFLESGNLQGRMTYLEVFKAPVFVDGVCIGICGTGRDMTEYVEAYRENDCGKCPSMNDIFKKYEYGEDM
jgi:PAS domain-containing protein